ncbi:MAG TPA: hypothetical protein ENK59_03070 [Thioploca sp.]|nr:hypothetical protein [Thioploca sp.]
MRKLSRDPLREAILKCLIFGSIAATMNVYADCNVIYGVHDEGLNNSQFVTIDRNTYAVSPLGAINPGYDIEGLDMNKAHELYGSSGDDPEGHPAGHLYKISTTDGSPQSIGDICFDVQGTEVCGTEVSAISFNPVTDDLWGWSEECGLINIDIDKPEYSTLKMPYSTDDLKACLSNIKRQRQKYTSTIEDISWDSNGKKIYYANGNEVYVYTPLTGDLEGPLSGSGLSGNVETVEMLPDNDKTLILIVDGFHKLFKLDIVNDEVSPITDSNVKSYTDIEGIAACIDGTVETISCDKMDSNIFAKFNWDGIGYIADSSAINNDSITITADENGGTWSVTDANITHVIVNATDAIDIDGASSGTFGNSNGVTTVEFCGTPVEPPIVVTCDEMGSDVFAKFNWNGEGYVADDSADNNDSIVISGNDTTGTWTATNAAITHVIVNTTDANSVSSTTEGSFNNADGITTVEFCGTPVEECTTEVENKWLYATDASYDATGSRGLEIYGTAIHRDGDTITVAISANMTPENPVYYEGENTNFTDYVFDFGGTKYAVHFAPDNDSGANAGVGLYEVTTFKDVTKKN